MQLLFFQLLKVYEVTDLQNTTQNNPFSSQLVRGVVAAIGFWVFWLSYVFLLFDIRALLEEQQAQVAPGKTPVRKTSSP